MYSLVGLEEGLKKAYRSVTEGKFSDALGRFNGLLHLVPLLVVDTRKEVDDVKELLSIAKCAFSCDSEQRSELSTPFTGTE